MFTKRCPVAIKATQYLRSMRGGAQAHLLLCDDRAYVVKFQNNPQNIRILANEWLATNLAAFLNLSVPDCELIDVDKVFTLNTAALKIRHPSREEHCKEGMSFGSRLVGGIMPGVVVDYLPESQLTQVVNLHEFTGFLAFDKWTCNADGRQAVFTRSAKGQKQYRASFIDQGYCFNGDWQLKDAPLRGTYARSSVYRAVKGWESFEPWLTAIEEFPVDRIWQYASMTPPEWYEFQQNELERLVERLAGRRHRIRELISEFRGSSRNPFPNWQ